MTIDRLDLAALVDMLLHEHFSYGPTGLAAKRAFHALEHALCHDTTITLTPALNGSVLRPGSDEPALSGSSR